MQVYPVRGERAECSRTMRTIQQERTFMLSPLELNVSLNQNAVIRKGEIR